MKSLYKAILIIGIVFSIIQCSEDFLEFQPKDGISDVTFFKSKTDFELVLFATYANLEDFWADGAMIQHANQPALDCYFWGIMDFNSYFLPTSSYYYWEMHYPLIHGANKVISRLEFAELNESDKVVLEAEARFLRGYAYFILNRTYGGVPLVLEPQEATASTIIARNTEQEVWTQVIADLKIAAEGLPVAWDDENVGRATKGAALAYIAQAKMYTKDWQGAKGAIDKLFSLNHYNLLPSVREYFSDGAENGVETVWELQQRANPENPGWGRTMDGNVIEQFTMPRGIGEEYGPYGGWAGYEILPELANSFEEGDNRRELILGVGETYHGERMAEGVAYTLTEGASVNGYLCVKYWRGPLPNGSVHSGVNVPFMRFANVLLNYAEILNELGETGNAYNYINQIRQRSGLENLVAGNKAQCLKDINTERRHEFFFETSFYWDLVRTNQIKEFLSENYGKTFQDHWKFWPIPQAEMDMNSALVQNQGYN
jgi:tetratricopeptide (TPR) repeat protein